MRGGSVGVVVPARGPTTLCELRRGTLWRGHGGVRDPRVAWVHPDLLTLSSTLRDEPLRLPSKGLMGPLGAIEGGLDEGYQQGDHVVVFRSGARCGGAMMEFSHDNPVEFVAEFVARCPVASNERRLLIVGLHGMVGKERPWQWRQSPKLACPGPSTVSLGCGRRVR